VYIFYYLSHRDDLTRQHTTHYTLDEAILPEHDLLDYLLFKSPAPALYDTRVGIDRNDIIAAGGAGKCGCSSRE